MRKVFKTIQVASMVVAGMILADPQLAAAFVPGPYQAPVAAGLALLGGILPSVAPVRVRRWWGGGNGGSPNLAAKP